MATFTAKGYGQVEPNRLTGITYGAIEAQAPAYKDTGATQPIPLLENGMFLCVISDKTGKSPSGRISVLPGVAPATSKPYLVFSERKTYKDDAGYSDFVDKADTKVGGKLYPRLIGLVPDSCVFTTNTINAASGSLKVGDTLYIGNDGYLTGTAGVNTSYKFTVNKVYTMPDGQEGVKLQVQAMA